MNLPLSAPTWECSVWSGTNSTVLESALPGKLLVNVVLPHAIGALIRLMWLSWGSTSHVASDRKIPWEECALVSMELGGGVGFLVIYVCTLLCKIRVTLSLAASIELTWATHHISFSPIYLLYHIHTLNFKGALQVWLVTALKRFSALQAWV